MFNTFDALAVSDVFIAKRVQLHPSEWVVLDAFKVNFGQAIKFAVQTAIVKDANDARRIGNSLQVQGDFAIIRRRKLDGIHFACGLIVSIFTIDVHIIRTAFRMQRSSSYTFEMVGLKYAYPEKFTYFDDPKTNHIDVFTKGSFNLTQHLFEDINMRLACLP